MKTVIGNVLAHLKPQNSPFSQICNVYHHYVLSRMLLAV